MSSEASVENTPLSIESTVQNWDQYTPADHEVWQILYSRRMEQLQTTASQKFLQGAELIRLAQHEIPNLDKVNRRLGVRTGWNAVPVGGFLPAKEFFASLSDRRFPTTCGGDRRVVECGSAPQLTRCNACKCESGRSERPR